MTTRKDHRNKKFHFALVCAVLIVIVCVICLFLIALWALDLTDAIEIL